MWLNERRRGARVERFLSAARRAGGAASSSSSALHGAAAPSPRRATPAGEMLCGGLGRDRPRRPASGPRRLAAWGSRLRAGRERRAAAGAAPGSRPSGRTTRARGGGEGGGAGPLKRAERPPDPPPRGALVAPGLRERGCPAATRPQAPPAARRAAVAGKIHFLGPYTLPFPASPFSVSSAAVT